MKRKKRAPEELVLMPVASRHYLRKRVYAGLLVGLVIAATYFFGEVRGRQGDLEAQRERDSLLTAVAGLTEELANAKEQIAVHKTGTEVTREAAEQVHKQIKALTGEIAELEEAVAFYKNVMSPGASEKGVHIQRFDLVPASVAGVYQYKLVLTQRGNNRYHLGGSVKVSLTGRNGVQPVTLSENILGKGSDTSFRFRYFQELTGRIKLPEGFQPEQVRISVKATGNRPSKAERSFVWQVQENNGNAWAG